MTQTGDTNQLISNSGYIYMPSRLSCLYFSLWGHYQLDLDVLCSLKTILETLQKLKGFIIRLDMRYSNVGWKPNWTGNHLCILRPMPAHSKWMTGGLSQFLRHSVLNLDRKKFAGGFHFPDFLSFVLYGSELNQPVRGLPPITRTMEMGIWVYLFPKRKSHGYKNLITQHFSNMQHTETIRVFLREILL